MLIHLTEILIGLTLLIWGGDRFVIGASIMAKNLGVTPLMIGLTIVSFATSAPEFLISIVASLRDTPDIAVGNAIGSNIANIGLVLGTMALIQPVKLTNNPHYEIGFLLGTTIIASLLFFDSRISRLDGLLLFIGFFFIAVFLVKKGLEKSPSTEQIKNTNEAKPNKKMISAIFWLILGLSALLYGAELLVNGSSGVARFFGISEIVIGVTLVALATSLPELVVSIISVLKGEYGLALGNIVGSNLFNLFAVIGIAAIIQPMTLPHSVLSFHIIIMLLLTLGLFLLSIKKRKIINRIEGTILLCIYFTFNGYLVFQSI